MNNKNIRSMVILISIMICFVGISLRFSSNKSSGKTPSEVLYDKIMSYDLDNNYPKAPSEVMQIYVECLDYLYGGKVNSTKIMDIVLVQRKLYANELLELNNDQNVQYTTTMMTVDTNKQNKFNYISITQDQPVFYDEADQTRCSIELTQVSNIKPDKDTLTDLNTNYYLVRNSNLQWKIIGWEDLKEE